MVRHKEGGTLLVQGSSERKKPIKAIAGLEKRDLLEGAPKKSLVPKDRSTAPGGISTRERGTPRKGDERL